MKTFTFEPYRGMKPDNHETMDAMLRIRFRQNLTSLRDAEKTLALYLLGIMSGTVAAMYDLGSPMAWQYQKAMYKARAILGL